MQRVPTSLIWGQRVKQKWSFLLSFEQVWEFFLIRLQPLDRSRRESVSHWDRISHANSPTASQGIQQQPPPANPSRSITHRKYLFLPLFSSASCASIIFASLTVLLSFFFSSVIFSVLCLLLPLLLLSSHRLSYRCLTFRRRHSREKTAILCGLPMMTGTTGESWFPSSRKPSAFSCWRKYTALSCNLERGKGSNNSGRERESEKESCKVTLSVRSFPSAVSVITLSAEITCITAGVLMLVSYSDPNDVLRK